MSIYNPVYLYSTEGAFIGSAVMGPHKLQSTNIYTSHETDQLNEQINRLNEREKLNNNWPTPNDPEVQALLSDATFEPLKYVWRDVIDEDHSTVVWMKDPVTDEDLPEIDEEASIVAWKTAQVPEQPTDVMVRIKKACETVARRRAGC